MLGEVLGERAAAGRPVRVVLVGAGAFGTMFLSQVRRVPGLQLVGVVDLSAARARAALTRAEWPVAETADVRITDDLDALLAQLRPDVLVEATGSPWAAVRNALGAFARGVHVVNVTVEADALVGPLLASRAREAGVAYGYAYGDQPALVCELVDWARVNGFEVVCAGKGTKYLPRYHASTPDTVWEYYGIAPEHAAAHGLNATMFNSFLDGTKSAIEMAAVANATGLVPQPDGLRFPPCEPRDLASVCIPEAEGGALATRGTVEVVASLARDGSPLEDDLRWGVYVVFAAGSDFVADRFREYGLATDPTGRFASLWRPYHLIGLELATSVALAGLRGETLGAPRAFVADVVAVAKRELAAGDVLEGEGGASVWGRLRRSQDAARAGELPIGLAHGARLRRSIAAGAPVRWADVELDEHDPIVLLRRELDGCMGNLGRSAVPAPPRGE